MFSRLALVGTILFQASSSLAEPSFSVAPAPSATVPPPQPPRPVQVYPVQPVTGAIVDPDTNSAKLAVLQLKQRECEQLQNEIRQLQSELGTVEQFRVRVQMLEVSLTKLKTMATELELVVAGEVKKIQIQDVESLRQAVAAGGSFSLPPSPRPYSRTPDMASPVGFSASPAGFVEWLKTNNLAKEIACPTLIVADGRPAKLFTGLEVPVPALATQTPANNYLRPGIEIELTAFSRENKQVRIDFHGSVRELDEAHSLVANGTKTPAVKTRQFATGLQGAIGEPLVLPGLVEERTVIYKSIFGTRQEVKEIALIAVIVPELVGPAAEAKPAIEDAKKQQIRPSDVVTVIFEQECGALPRDIADGQDSNIVDCSYRIAARVAKVRANGDLELEARREILTDNSVLHRQELTGVVHPESIDLESRTVPSSQVAELRVTTHAVSTPTAGSKRR